MAAIFVLLGVVATVVDYILMEYFFMIPFTPENIIDSLTWGFNPSTPFTLPSPVGISFAMFIIAICFLCFWVLSPIFLSIGMIVASFRFDKASGKTGGFMSLAPQGYATFVGLLPLIYLIPILTMAAGSPILSNYDYMLGMLSSPYSIWSLILGIVFNVSIVLFGIALIFMGKSTESGFVKTVGILSFIFIGLNLFSNYIMGFLSMFLPLPFFIAWPILDVIYLIILVGLEVFYAAAFLKLSSKEPY